MTICGRAINAVMYSHGDRKNVHWKLLFSPIGMLSIGCSPEQAQPDSRPPYNYVDPMIGKWAADEASCKAYPVEISTAYQIGDLYLLQRTGLSCLLAVAPIDFGGGFDFPTRCHTLGRHRTVESVFFNTNDPNKLTLRHRSTATQEAGDEEALHWCGAPRDVRRTGSRL